MVKVTLCATSAAEGDVRLIEEEKAANWVIGRLQVFFEGSWSQVCATSFNADDADVACRQLGFGSGTVMPRETVRDEAKGLIRSNVFPEIAVIGSSCNGTEVRLVDCATTPPGSEQDYINDNDFARDCLNVNGGGLRIGCVAAQLQGPDPGVLLRPLWILHGSSRPFCFCLLAQSRSSSSQVVPVCT